MSRRVSRRKSGFYCSKCGALYSSTGWGVITCQRCGGLGLRGFEREPHRVLCPHGCDWQGWDDGGVNNDLDRHMRQEHTPPAVVELSDSPSHSQHGGAAGE